MYQIRIKSWKHCTLSEQNEVNMHKTKAFSVLFVEDDPIIRQNYVAELNLHFRDVYEASDANEGYQIYQNKRPHIIIADINLPGINGLEFLKKVRSNDQITRTIILSAHSSKELLVRAATLKLSAYLIKPINRIDFRQAIKNVIDDLRAFQIRPIEKTILSSIIHKQQKLASALQTKNKTLEVENKELLKLSVTDKLTGLFNRTKIDESLNQQLDLVKQGNSATFSLMLLDIDSFKSINDNHGHIIGDKVLFELAKLLSKNTRKTDIVGRWGGEEFMVICLQTNRLNAIKMAKKLNTLIANHHFSAYNKKVTISIGVCEHRLGHSIEKTIALCDGALYRAKNRGKNGVESHCYLNEIFKAMLSLKGIVDKYTRRP